MNRHTHALRNFRRVVVRYSVIDGTVNMTLLGQTVQVPERQLGAYIRNWGLQHRLAPIMFQVDPERLQAKE